MLYKDYCIIIWKTDWIGRKIGGEWYSLASHAWNASQEAKSCKYIALFRRIDYSCYGCAGGSTPLIALDLAKFSINLRKNIRGIMKREQIYWQVRFI
jgi:hypothetical protein